MEYGKQKILPASIQCKNKEALPFYFQYKEFFLIIQQK